MRCFVTGASGFIGSNLVHALVARGHQVRALIRPHASQELLRGLEIDLVQGDLADVRSLEAGLRGCDWCFHVAGCYSLWLADYGVMFATNVEGTRNVLTAAGGARCRKIVYTSTVGCIGLSRNTNGSVPVADETTPVDERQMTCPYKLSKWRAEQEALALARHGLPVIIVNPSTTIGPRDTRPTPSGRVILDALQRRLPGYVDTGLNLVHVRDVAEGHILAAERGRPGERYILGNAQGNWSLKKMLGVLESITGISQPRLRFPYPLVLAAAHLNESFSRLTKRPPRIPLAGVRLARHKMFFNPRKAIIELGLPQTAPEQGIEDAAVWFREQKLTSW